MDILRQLHREGSTIIVVTHAPEVAAHAERTIVLGHGKIVRVVRGGEALGVPADETGGSTV
jgi:putative ABC transport system ATP-binding protein